MKKTKKQKKMKKFQKEKEKKMKKMYHILQVKVGVYGGEVFHSRVVAVFTCHVEARFTILQQKKTKKINLNKKIFGKNR
jgi:hypothetical protein